MTEKLAETLLEAGISTVEKLGAMTPEDLEAIQNIGPKTVERIQVAVNNYFGQYEEALGVGEAESFEPAAVPGTDASAQPVEGEPASTEAAGIVEAAAETDAAAGAGTDAAAGSAAGTEAETAAEIEAQPLEAPPSELVAESSDVDESARIKDAD